MKSIGVRHELEQKRIENAISLYCLRQEKLALLTEQLEMIRQAAQVFLLGLTIYRFVYSCWRKNPNAYVMVPTIFSWD